MKTFEQFNDLDPYGEEDWDYKEPEELNGYVKIRILRNSDIYLSYGDAEEDNIYDMKLELNVGDELYVDIIDDHGDSVTLTADTGDDYVGVGILGKNKFEIIE